MEILIYLTLGAGTGLLAGLFGIGGGLIIVPVLLFVFAAHGFSPQSQMHLAIGTSLAAIMATAVSSIYSHHRHGAVLWEVFVRLAPGIVAGTAAGAWIADEASNAALRYFFAAFMLLVALQMALGLSPKGRTARGLPGGGATFGAGAGIGVVSALVGIGGGTLTTPFLLSRGVGLRHAIATSAACGLPIAITGAIGYAVAGLHADGLPPGATGYVYWPAAGMIAVTSVCTAPLGAYLTHRLPVPLLKRLFALLLAAVAIRLFGV